MRFTGDPAIDEIALAMRDLDRSIDRARRRIATGLECAIPLRDRRHHRLLAELRELLARRGVLRDIERAVIELRQEQEQ